MLHNLLVLAAWCPPSLHLLSGLMLLMRHGSVGRSPAVSAVAFAFALAAAALTPFGAEVAGITRLDAVSAVVRVLVGLLGFVIVRFAVRYLEGDRVREAHIGWLHLTLACVFVLIGAEHLGVLWVAWLGASLGVSRLLLHAPDRRGAQMAAREKFLVSRLADAVFVVGLALVQVELGTLSIAALNAAASAPLPPTLHLAALAMALGVVMKSALIPFHGWITQVMEAPTPVSALLHAGVVNIGGYVLISLAPFFAATPAAQLLLVGAGTSTAVIAGWVRATRVSIKSSLAWSTIGQMGFMVVECGLGVAPLALLHLVAHSLYKAHAFLSAGSTVERWSALDLASGPSRGPTVGDWGVGLITGLLAVFGATWLLGYAFGHAGAAVLLGVLAFGLCQVVASGWSRPTTRGPVLVLAFAAAVLVVGLHQAFDALIPHGNPPVASGAAAWVAGVGFTFALVVQGVVRLDPVGAFASRLRQGAARGFHLDLPVTRLTFALLPPPTRSVARVVTPWRAVSKES